MASEPAPIVLDLRLPNDRLTPALARRAVSILADRVVPEVLEVACLLTSELVTNAVRHAGLSPDDPIGLQIDLGERLRIEVTDAGQGFRWGRLPSVDPWSGDGGLGFLLVAELAASWGVESGPPTCVWFELDPRNPFGSADGRVPTHAKPTRRE